MTVGQRLGAVGAALGWQQIGSAGGTGVRLPPMWAGASPAPQGTLAHPSPTMPNTESIRTVLGPGRLPWCSAAMASAAAATARYLEMNMQPLRCLT